MYVFNLQRNNPDKPLQFFRDENSDGQLSLLLYICDCTGSCQCVYQR